MINTEILQGLKRVNCSSDNEKTKERIKSMWQGASRDEKSQFLNSSSILDSTIYRIYHTGTVIPKVVVQLAQHFNCDPSFLTGDTDEKGEWSDQALNGFLRSKGYGELLDSTNWKPKRKYVRRDTPKPTASDKLDEMPAEQAKDKADLKEVTIPCESDIQASEVIDLSEDDLILLLKALKLRAKHNIDANEQLKRIVGLLLD